MKRANLHVTHEIEQRRLAHVGQAHYSHFQVAFHAAEAAGRLLHRGCDCFGWHYGKEVGDTHAGILFCSFSLMRVNTCRQPLASLRLHHGIPRATPVVPPSEKNRIASCVTLLMSQMSQFCINQMKPTSRHRVIYS